MQTTRLGAFLRTLRKRYHLSQKELADQLGIQRQSYSHYETGRNKPPIDILVHLSDIYHISVEAFTQISNDSGISAMPNNIVLNDEMGGYLLFNSNIDALKYINLDEYESDLINHFRLLNSKNRQELIEIAKLKVRLQDAAES